MSKRNRGRPPKPKKKKRNRFEVYLSNSPEDQHTYALLRPFISRGEASALTRKLWYSFLTGDLDFLKDGEKEEVLQDEQVEFATNQLKKLAASKWSGLADE